MSALGGRARVGNDVIAAIRRSVVGVRSPTSGGTGSVVLGNGLVLTSHMAVGFHREVHIELENGRRCPARVISLEVARDIAYVMPRDPLGLPPLLPRTDLPKLGEPGLLLSALPGEPFRVAAVLITSVDRKLGSTRCFEVDASLASAGGPVLDLDGRLIGVGGLDLPRGAWRAPPSPTTARIALPITAVQRSIATFDVPPAQLEGREPSYRCPSCGETYDAAYERCLACGARLPHAGALPEPAPRPFEARDVGLSVAGARLVQEISARMGPGAAWSRVGAHGYRLAVPSPVAGAEPLELTASIEPAAGVLRAHVPLARAPHAAHEAWLRFLLTANDLTTGASRLYLDDDVIHLGFAVPLATLQEPEATQLIEDLLDTSARLRKAIVAAFDTKAVR